MTTSPTFATTPRRQAGITLVELLVSMVILTIVTTMIIAGWFSLQSSFARTSVANDARSDARDALNRMSVQIRTASAPPGSPSDAAVFTVANPTEVRFYSSFNVLGQRSDGSSTDSLRLTKIYLGGTMPYQALYLVRDTNNDGTVGNSGDQQITLASNVVNNSVPSTGAPTAVFTYGYRDSGGSFQTATTVASADLAKIISVSVRVMVDANLTRTPTPVDLQTMVRPQNAPQN